jgi:hypothetical protein
MYFRVPVESARNRLESGGKTGASDMNPGTMNFPNLRFASRLMPLDHWPNRPVPAAKSILARSSNGGF